MLPAGRYNLTRAKLLKLLADLKTAPVGIVSLCVPPGAAKASIEKLITKISDARCFPEDISNLMAESPSGAMLFSGPQQHYLIIPPFPLDVKEGVITTCEIEPLYSLMTSELILGLVMVRLGKYAIGVLQGERLLSSKVGTGLVHARHRQGGSSAHRFERHREKQIETFFTRICLHAREQLEPYARRIDYIIYGGARETVLDFRSQCRFLHEFDNRALGRLISVREPDRAGLIDSIQEAWSSRVVSW